MGIFTKKKTADAKVAKDDAKKPAPIKAAPKEETKQAAAKKDTMKDLYKGEQAAAKTSKVTKDGKKPVRQYGRAYRVLIRPLITEKAANLGTEDKYVFAVANDANKIEISKAIDEVYGIKPIKVNIITNKGKKVRSGRTFGKRKDWKKAIITLPKGKTIKVYEGV
jgi:large subunit ribosomal protein L23